MPVLMVGKTSIAYSIRKSAKAKSRRIIISADKVEVVVPLASSDEDINTYLHKKRHWIYDQTEIIKEKRQEQTTMSRFVSGAKIPYRGRMMRLRVESTSDSLVSIIYKNGFFVKIPESIAKNAWDRIIESEFKIWFKMKLKSDIKVLIQQYGNTTHELRPKAFHIKAQKHLWASCGKDHIINLNWHLIFAPRSVLEYAVVHELCHLKYRNHSEAFWRLVREVMPDYEIRKRWLEQNEHVLNVDAFAERDKIFAQDNR